MPDLLSIAHLLPPYLSDVEGYLAVTIVSRNVRLCIREHTAPHDLLSLCYASRRIFFRPDPVYLLAALSRGISFYAAPSGRRVASDEPPTLLRLLPSD